MSWLGYTAADRALEFVATSDAAAQSLEGPMATVFLAAAGVAVVAAVVFLLLGAGSGRRSSEALDRLASRLEGGDE